MSKLKRFEGTVDVFASEAGARERTVFGTEIIDDDISEQINTFFKRGWGIVGNADAPSMQDFNALGFTLSHLIGYLYQQGLPIWSGKQTYQKDSYAIFNSQIVRCKTNDYANETSPLEDSGNWEPLLQQSIGDSEISAMSQKAATDSFAKLVDMLEVLQYGSPLWQSIRAPFAEGAQVYLDGRQWVSQVSGNNTKPVSGNEKWFPISVSSNQLIRAPLAVEPVTGGAAPSLSGPLTATAYAPIYSVDVRDYRRFEVTTLDDIGFNSVIFTEDVDADTVAISPALSTTTAYIWRCKDVSVTGTESEYSEIQEFTTASTYIVAPNVNSPANNEAGVVEAPTVVLSPFAVVGGVDSLNATSVRIKRKSNGVIVWSQDNTTPLNNIPVPSGILLENTEYTVEGKYHGASLGESAWGLASSFTTITNFVRIEKPTVIAPADGAVDQPEQPVIQISAFTVIAGTDTHTGTSVEVKDSLGDVVWSQDNITPLNNIPVAAGVLVENETYTVRVRYHGTAIADSPWSDWSVFTTATDFIIDTPGAAFGGGYVAGKIKVGSSTYLLIVSGGGGDSFQVDNSNHAWKTANTADATVDGAAPASMNDGLANFNYMKAQGLVNYPFAKWVEDTCNAGAGLGGKKDWYPPSRDEEEIVYRTFKPKATANSVSARSASGFGGDGAAYGVNANSVPAGVAYTASNPPVTPLANFKVGGADAFDASNYYWSSSENSAGNAWYQHFHNGIQYDGSKTSTYRVRAVRRVLIS